MINNSSYYKINGNIYSGSAIVCNTGDTIEHWLHYTGVSPNTFWALRWSRTISCPNGFQDVVASDITIEPAVPSDTKIITFTPTVPGTYLLGFNLMISGSGYPSGAYDTSTFGPTLIVRQQYPSNEFIITFQSSSTTWISQVWRDMIGYNQLSTDGTNTITIPQGMRSIPIAAASYSVFYPSPLTSTTGTLSGTFTGTIDGRLFSDVTGTFNSIPNTTILYPFSFKSGTFIGSISGTMSGYMIGTGSLFGNFTGQGSASINGGSTSGWSGSFTQSSISGTIEASIQYFSQYEYAPVNVLDIFKNNTSGVDRIRLAYISQNPFTNNLVSGTLDSLPL